MSFVSRLVKVGAAGAAVLTVVGTLAVNKTTELEGRRNQAYRDVVGVATICDGETRGVKMGDYLTDEQCDKLTVEALVGFEKRMVACWKPAITPKVPDKTYVAHLLLAYNIGSSGYCGSSVVRRQNEGNFDAACDAFDAWNKGTIRGRKVVLPGLVNRRNKEQVLCRNGLREGAPKEIPIPRPRPEIEPLVVAVDETPTVPMVEVPIVTVPAEPTPAPVVVQAPPKESPWRTAGMIFIFVVMVGASVYAWKRGER